MLSHHKTPAVVSSVSVMTVEDVVSCISHHDMLFDEDGNIMVLIKRKNFSYLFPLSSTFSKSHWQN